MQAPLVSIIIPTYNRAHLIGETLDSVLAQTYTNWECIVVDDGSADNTSTLLAEYCTKDSRFQYHHRPSDRPKGANACRNYGFELSKGEYVNWFDSDDLMKVNLLMVKVQILTSSKCNFVITKTSFFKNSIQNATISKDYSIIDKPSLYSFVCKNQNWYTLDGMFIRDSLKTIKWNEKLNSGQEFNYICKYLNMNFEGVFNNTQLSYARVHNESIHSFQNSFNYIFNLNKFKAYFFTYLELNNNDSLCENFSLVKNKLLDLSISFSFNVAKNNKEIPFFRKLNKLVLIEKGFINFFYYNLSIILAYVVGKGYLFMNKSRSTEQV